jgi:hypothetical protein
MTANQDRQHDPDQLQPEIGDLANTDQADSLQTAHDQELQTAQMLPKVLAPAARVFDAWSVRNGWPGPPLAFRVSKAP